MKEFYFIEEDGIYSNIIKRPEEFEDEGKEDGYKTFKAAKRALIKLHVDHINDYKQILKWLRTVDETQYKRRQEGFFD